jgi:flagellar basal body-associated protein FliL
VLHAEEPDQEPCQRRRGGLKEELLTRIRDELNLKNVVRIYFTEFVIQ